MNSSIDTKIIVHYYYEILLCCPCFILYCHLGFELFDFLKKKKIFFSVISRKQGKMKQLQKKTLPEEALLDDNKKQCSYILDDATKIIIDNY